MLDEIRQAAARQRRARTLRVLKLRAQRLLSQSGEIGGQVEAGELIERLERLEIDELADFFGYLAADLSPDPAAVLRLAEAYAKDPDARTLIDLVRGVEPPRQELLRRINRAPGGTAAIVRLRRALLRALPKHPQWHAIEADLLHLLTSWFNPGFLQMKRVDWNAPAQLLEKLIVHEAVHTIDGWDDLRRRLQPDRRCFAFFHPQLPDEPLIFVEVALVAEMPAAIAPLLAKDSTPLPADRFRVAAFYSISNCEPGLRGVSLGNFLIKSVAQQLQGELPRVRTFCTLSPVPGFAAWLLGPGDFAALALPKGSAQALHDAREALRAACGGDLRALQHAATHDKLGEPGERALQTLAAAYLVRGAPQPGGDPVARFHLDNGARLERINLRGNMSAAGLKQSFGVMVNYLYDLPRVEASHARFRAGEVAHSRAVSALL